MEESQFLRGSTLRQELSEEEMVNARRAFAEFDSDGSGSIDASELRQVLLSLGQNPTEEGLFVMISSVDDDGNRRISFD
eukprot:312502-Pyramimonas_sp.AAC.1